MRELYIFSDASMTKDPRNNVSIGCAGAIAVDASDYSKIIKKSREVLYKYTNNMSELYGIKLALKIALEYRNSYDKISIISDSRLCVETFKEWIYSWMNNITPELELISSSGQPVMNQHIILDIIMFIVSNNLKVSIYHIKGHVKQYKESDMIKAYNTFVSINGIDISEELLNVFVHYNNMVDFDTRNFLEEYYNAYMSYTNPNDIVGCPIHPMIQVPTMNDIEIYKTLINHKGY
jgi:ribonuclease HI